MLVGSDHETIIVVATLYIQAITVIGLLLRMIIYGETQQIQICLGSDHLQLDFMCHHLMINVEWL